MTDDELRERLLEYVASGKSVRTAASLCGISPVKAESIIGDEVSEVMVTEDIEDIKALARRATADAVMTLIDVARNSKSDAARVAAATALLDRGYGKPAQTTVVEGLTAINIVGLDIPPPATLIDGEVRHAEGPEL